MYNPEKLNCNQIKNVLFDRDFDMTWLFSVFTHLNPNDSFNLKTFLRQYIRENGKLFLSAFIDEDLNSFKNRIAVRPINNTYNGRGFMNRMI